MKINIILALLFLSIIIIASDGALNNPVLIGCTELNGNGCVCHNLEQDTTVSVWVEGPDTLLVGQTGYYRMYMAGGPAEGGGYNVAGRFGEMVLVDTFSYQHPMALNELTQAFTLPFPTPEDTIYWEFGYTASDSSAIDTIYSCGISLVWDSIPDPLDQWNFGPKFPVTIIPVTSVEPATNNLPGDFVLEQNYPNPFNPSTKIKFDMPKSSFVKFVVYDITGREVESLVNENMNAGTYEVNWNAAKLSSGIYFYKLETNEFIETKRMVLIK